VAKTIANLPFCDLLPVSIQRLFDDFLSACEPFAVRLEDEELAGGGALLSRWRSAADALAEPSLFET
jgi:hypothetical protein